MADMSGQDPSEIIMATVDEERKGVTFSGTVILGIDPEGGEAVSFRGFLIEDYKGELTAYLATDGDIKKSIDLGELDHKNPSFRLPIPPGTDTSPYNTVVLSDKKSKKKILTINL
jgi:citrate synthase